MPILEVEHRYNATPDRLFAAISNLEDWPLSLLDCSKMEFESFAPLGLGTEFIESRLFRGFYLRTPWEVHYHWRIKEWKLADGFVMEQTDQPESRREYRIQREGTSCILKLRMETSSNFSWLFIRNILKKTFQQDLLDFEKML